MHESWEHLENSQKSRVERAEFVFINHDHRDRDAILRSKLVESLLDEDLLVFVDDANHWRDLSEIRHERANNLLGIPGGKDWSRHLENAAWTCGCFISICSKNSAQKLHSKKSNWVKEEIEIARSSPGGRGKIIPLALESHNTFRNNNKLWRTYFGSALDADQTQWHPPLVGLKLGEARLSGIAKAVKRSVHAHVGRMQNREDSWRLQEHVAIALSATVAREVQAKRAFSNGVVSAFHYRECGERDRFIDRLGLLDARLFAATSAGKRIPGATRTEQLASLLSNHVDKLSTDDIENFESLPCWTSFQLDIGRSDDPDSLALQVVKQIHSELPGCRTAEPTLEDTASAIIEATAPDPRAQEVGGALFFIRVIDNDPRRAAIANAVSQISKCFENRQDLLLRILVFFEDHRGSVIKFIGPDAIASRGKRARIRHRRWHLSKSIRKTCESSGVLSCEASESRLSEIVRHDATNWPSLVHRSLPEQATEPVIRNYLDAVFDLKTVKMFGKGGLPYRLIDQRVTDLLMYPYKRAQLLNK